MILLLVAVIQSIAPAIAPSDLVRPSPPVVISPPVVPVVATKPHPPMPSFEAMSAVGQALVKEQDAKVAAQDRNDALLESEMAVAWVDALKASPFDAARLKRAGQVLDGVRHQPGVFAGWADVMAKLNEDDRKILVPRLSSARGRVYYVLPAPPAVIAPSARENAQRTALTEGMATLFKKMGEHRQSEDRIARQLKIEMLRNEAAGILRRKPFDPVAARAALRRVDALKNEDDALTTDATFDVIAGLPADQRDAVIDVIWSDSRSRKTPRTDSK